MGYAFEILEIGTVAGTSLTRFVVRSWREKEDQDSDFRPMIRCHDFGPNRLAGAHERVKRDTQNRVQRKSDGAWIDLDALPEAERPGKEQLETEIIDAKPHETALAWLHAYYRNFYSSPSGDGVLLDESDPAGVFGHPDLRQMKTLVAEGKFPLQEGPSK